MIKIEINQLKYIVIKLCDLVLEFNNDLKNSSFHNIIQKVNSVLDITKKNHPNFNEFIIYDVNLGKNIVFSSFSGKILFPSFLYSNNFRLLIINELKRKIYQFQSINDFEFFFSSKIKTTLDIKKGGFTKQSLETLRFYQLNFDKIIDNDVNKFLPYINSYKHKYIRLRNSTLIKRFPLTQKYSTYYILPNFQHFGLNAVMLQHDDSIDSILNDSEFSPFGFLFNDKKEKLFSLYFTPYNRNLKSNFIEQISFFENLDLFHLDPSHRTYYNKTMNILELYYKYSEDRFADRAVSFDVNLCNKKIFPPQVDNLDLFIHLLNTRKFPDDHHVHPVSKYLFTYRNKIVNFYGTTSYFIYIYEPDGKIIQTQSDIIVTLLKNTFSNGFIIKSKSAFLVSTFLFKEDFEKQRASFLEFFSYFKLEVQIFENLNYTPFSFYYMPNSTHFNVDTNHWKFPTYQDKTIEELMQYQVKNLQTERSRLKNQVFKQRVDNFYTTWSDEVNSLKNSLG